MKQLVKNLLFRIASWLPAGMAGRATILMYHSVSERSEYFFSITPETFRDQMRHLQQRGHKVVPLSDLVARMARGDAIDGEIAITFDDGYLDNFTHAYPVLKEFNLPATVFLITGIIGATGEGGAPMLSEQQIRQMQASGLIDFEPHSVGHLKLAQLDAASAGAEIGASKQHIETMLGKRCDVFAYPFGDFNDETVGLVEKQGYRGAVTVIEGSVRAGDELLRLKRNCIDRTTTWIQFLGKIGRGADWYLTIKRFGR